MQSRMVGFLDLWVTQLMLGEGCYVLCMKGLGVACPYGQRQGMGIPMLNKLNAKLMFVNTVKGRADNEFK